ncbi:MAG: (deoxy)nucleoside triphosphate pyrophosphohydrolase [Succinivibrio sp.]|nr:(deoxy)nucleoside triphosphate pyrophosphohydrolase [Succinivibrio sp.]
MRRIEVVAGILTQQQRIFATQRGYGEFKDFWEFPGGKVEAGESQEQALVRELKEELETEVEVLKHFADVEYDYPHFHLCLHLFFCRVRQGLLELKEHEQARWLSAQELFSVNWLPADLKVVEKLRLYLEQQTDEA